MIPTEGIALVSGEYQNLNQTLKELKSGIDKKVARELVARVADHKIVINEKDLKVNELQSEVDRLEQVVATDQKANELEVERDWFKKESLHISGQLGEAKGRIAALEAALEESNREREWLKEQIEKFNNKK